LLGDAMDSVLLIFVMFVCFFSGVQRRYDHDHAHAHAHAHAHCVADQIEWIAPGPHWPTPPCQARRDDTQVTHQNNANQRAKRRVSQLPKANSHTYTDIHTLPHALVSSHTSHHPPPPTLTQSGLPSPTPLPPLPPLPSYFYATSRSLTYSQ
jgi:hypothetical protein